MQPKIVKYNNNNNSTETPTDHLLIYKVINTTKSIIKSPVYKNNKIVKEISKEVYKERLLGEYSNKIVALFICKHNKEKIGTISIEGPFIYDKISNDIILTTNKVYNYIINHKHSWYLDNINKDSILDIPPQREKIKQINN
jgi:hypothetical protein